MGNARYRNARYRQGRFRDEAFLEELLTYIFGTYWDQIIFGPLVWFSGARVTFPRATTIFRPGARGSPGLMLGAVDVREPQA